MFIIALNYFSVVLYKNNNFCCRFLAGSGRTFGRPISGQGEVVGVSSQYASYTEWISKEGLFVHPSDLLPHQHAIHTEL